MENIAKNIIKYEDEIDIYEDTYSEVNIDDYTQYVANKYYIYENGEYKISLNEFNENIKYYTKDILLKQDSLNGLKIMTESVIFFQFRRRK